MRKEAVKSLLESNELQIYSIDRMFLNLDLCNPRLTMFILLSALFGI